MTATLPPRLMSAAIAAADHLTAIAHSEGIQLTGDRGEARTSLVAILYVIRERVAKSEKQPQPYMGDKLITPAEIASVLESIGQMLISDDSYELVGHNPAWFLDAAAVIERMAWELDGNPEVPDG